MDKNYTWFKVACHFIAEISERRMRAAFANRSMATEGSCEADPQLHDLGDADIL